jgi:hypothetical protein
MTAEKKPEHANVKERLKGREILNMLKSEELIQNLLKRKHEKEPFPVEWKEPHKSWDYEIF